MPYGRRRCVALGRLLLLAIVVLGCGCTRERYRLRADRDAYNLVEEHGTNPRWDLPGFTIDMDPRARYYDPTNRDHPAMPYDDPAANVYMNRVDGMRGWPFWYRDGVGAPDDNPSWYEMLGTYAEMDEQGQVLLTLDNSVRLAIMHSPDYRDEIETLYLSALDVSTERFRFDTQFFGSLDLFYTHTGRKRGGGEASSELALDRTIGFTRQFATGGELLVGFANAFVWQFAGPDTNSNVSILNFSLIQPLLRGGGRAVALEQLTIVERALLYNMRAFERYRQGFYTNVAMGDGGVEGPQRRGGFFGGTGLTGFTGQGAGGFGGVGGATGFGRGGFGGAGGGGGGGGTGFAGGGAGTVGGFIGLLQQLQQIRNTQDSLDAQLRTLELLDANLRAGFIDIVQVDQFRQNIETERANLLQSQSALANSLENFNRGTLGLPPDLPVALDDDRIRQFQLIAPAVNELQNMIADYLDFVGELPQVPTEDEVFVAMNAWMELRELVARPLEAIEADLKLVDERSAERLQTMDRREQPRFLRELEGLRVTYSELQSRFATFAAVPDIVLLAMAVQGNNVATDTLVAATTQLNSLVQEASLVQARARLEAVVLNPVKLNSDQALQIARLNRLDWMNNRAALVDTWRLIEFNANALLSDLDIVFTGDIQTVDDNPMKFQAPTGTLTAGLQFDAPFARLLERNNYRQVLIDYQRDRRRLMQYEDVVNQTLRATLRQLNQLEANLEIQRRAVAIAVRRVDQTREVLQQVPPPAAPGEPVTQLGPTAALDMLTALSDLRNSQNNFMSVWLNYYATRMVLMRELGIMQLDNNGLWIDVPLETALEQACTQLVDPLPPPVPYEWLEPGEPSNVEELPIYEGPVLEGIDELPAARSSSNTPRPVHPTVRSAGRPESNVSSLARRDTDTGEVRQASHWEPAGESSKRPLVPTTAPENEGERVPLVFPPLFDPPPLPRPQ